MMQCDELIGVAAEAGAADAVMARCVRLISQAGIEVICAAFTPIVQPDGSRVLAADAHGMRVAVRDASGARWDYVTTAEPAGDCLIARGVFTGADEAGRQMFLGGGA